jgi:glutathione S-transferase
MAFKLHGVSQSTCTRRVALIAKERNLRYEVVPVDFHAGEHKQAAHVQHQPFGQVPYITVRHFPSPYLMECPYVHFSLSFLVI